ncbi:hypothetical protein MRX96_016954 [Rhipicephalus microplus]
MMTEGAKESSTQTEPLTISSDGVRLNENAAFANTHFITSVCEGKMLTIHAQRLVLHNRKQRPKLDGFELLHDLFENEPSVSVVHEQVVNITATTTARAETTAPVVAKMSVTAAHSAHSAKVRKAANIVHRKSIAMEDARGTAYAVRKLSTTAGIGRTSTPSTTMGHSKGMQVVGTQDPAQPKYHLDEVTGKNDVLSRIVYEL